MARKVGLLLVALAVLGAAVWFLGGTAGLFGTDRSREVGGAGDAAPRTVGGPDEAADEAAGAGRSAAALEARRPERRGIGSLAARITDVKDAPLAAASFHVTGTGHGGEAVALQATSNPEGAVLLPSVPAGLGYVVRVEVQGKPSVTIPDVEIRAGRRKDLGAIAVGARAALTGTVVDENGTAVAGADVRAFSSHENLFEILGNMMELFTSLGHEPTPLAQAKSDDDGRFRLADLPPGPVLVRATTLRKRAGFAKVRMTAEGPAEGPVTVRLEPGAPVAGVVVEASGAPVAGATVAIMSQGASSEGGADDIEGAFDFFTRRIFAVTDAKGAFTALVAETAKDLRGIVEAPGFPTTVSREFSAGDTDVRIVIARGAVLEVAVLDDATSKPVVGAQVVAMVGEGMAFGAKESGGGILYGVTDDRGVVALPTGPGKVEMLMVSHASYAATMASPSQQEAMRSMGNPLGGEGVEMPKEIKANETARGTVRLKAGVRLMGRVTEAGGAPVPGVEVKPMAFFGGGGGSSTRTDAEGNYQLNGLTGIMGQPAAMVSFRAPGYVAATETVMVNEAAIAAGEIRKDVTLRRAATIRGRVLDEDGKPVVGARVRHTGLSGGFDLAALMGSGGVTTDTDGAYVLTEVPPAAARGSDDAPKEGDGEENPLGRLSAMMDLRLAVSAEGFVPARTDPLKVREGEQIELPPIRLSRGVVAKGVIRLPGGRVAAGARVDVRLEPESGPADMAEMIQSMAMAGRGTRVVRADAEGRYEVSGLAKGTLTVVARAEGFAPSRRKAKVGTEPVQVDVTLRPAADLTGRVHGSDGKPLAKATVGVEGGLAGFEGDEGYVETASTVTDGEGRFTLRALPPGSVTVAVRAEGHKRATLTGVPGGAPLDVRLEARSGRRPREEVQKEVNEVSMKFATAKDADERKALQVRLTELMQEMNEEEPGGPEVVAPEPTSPPR